MKRRCITRMDRVSAQAGRPQQGLVQAWLVRKAWQGLETKPSHPRDHLYLPADRPPGMPKAFGARKSTAMSHSYIVHA